MATTVFHGNDLFDFFVYKYFEYDYDIAANSNDSFNQTELAFDIPDGYEIFAIKEFHTSNSYITVSNIYPHPTNPVQVRVRNVSSSRQTGTFGMTIVFVKAGFIDTL